ncbi:hypothetical protein MTR_8g073295 [Medicago truncatula]|uniref:Uncharacterized protein n=1 Tax=Medicago truncatula TaxID=3880 RepID=A0A072TU73_MEDTR|nr:hypothetical protein MTR_8g073295 [Medicago truncatula]
MLTGFHYRAIHHLCPRTKPNRDGREEWRQSSPHKPVLGPIKISKMVSKPLQDPLDHMLSDFHYRATHHLCERTKPNNVGGDELC